MNYGPIIAYHVRQFVKQNKWRAEKWVQNMTEQELRECGDDIAWQLKCVDNLIIKDKLKGFDVIKIK